MCSSNRYKIHDGPESSYMLFRNLSEKIGSPAFERENPRVLRARDLAVYVGFLHKIVEPTSISSFPFRAKWKDKILPTVTCDLVGKKGIP
jgi:hypothetical protein